LAAYEHSHTAVAVFVVDRRRSDVFLAQGIFLFGGKLTDLRKNRFQGLGLMGAKAQKVRIPSRAVSVSLQKAKKLSAFENKAIRVGTLSQA
jgi:hypothetical protein